MEKNVNIDNKKINQLVNISNKILKNLHILVLLITTYVILLLLTKSNILYFISTFIQVLSPFFLGILIAWLLRPIVNYLEKKGMNRILALSLVYIFIFLVFYIIIVTMIPKFILEFSEFIKMFPSIINNIFDKISFIDVSDLKKEMLSLINNFLIDTGKKLPVTLMNVIKIISSIVIGLIISFYLLISNTAITINMSIKKDTYELIMKINSILRNYVKGVMYSSLIVFILCFIVFYILGLENSLIFGFICGITNIIPYIGPYIGAVLPVLVAFTKSSAYGLLIILVIFIIQTIEANVIQPIIISKSIKMHPVESIVSLLIFGYFLGVFGMIFAVPIMASLKVVYSYLRKRYSNYKKNLIK